MAEGRHFNCFVCGEHFIGTRTEEEAQAEMRDNFGSSITVDDCEQVCDDCYKIIMRDLNN